MNKICFDQEQQKAVDHVEGPLLCLAGPGSGKTTVITGRVASLIDKGIPPEKLLVITFTQSAAREMEQRFYQLRPEVNKGKILFSTFHALFFRILRVAYGYTKDNIVSAEQKNMYFKNIIETLKVDVEDEADYISKLQAEIGLVKAEGMNPDRYFPINFAQETFLKAYRMYEEQMIKDRLIDFDDMQVLCYELLKARKDILKKWQEKFTYILVDEAQDTNLLQYKLICMLAAPEDNLMLVGDDDQSIYRFRGARPEILLNFPKHYNVKTVCLSTNYRCGSSIVEASGKLIADNAMRFDKSLKAADGAERGLISRRLFDDPGEESREILKDILSENKKGKPYENMAVLFRTNLSARNVVDELLKAGVPMSLRDVIPNLYDHWIFRDIRTYITIAEGNRDRSNFIAIINRPKRYISREAFSDSLVSLFRLRMYYSDKPYVQERIDKLSCDLNMLKGMKPYAAIHYIRHGVAYEDYIKEYAQSRNINPQDLLEIFDEIEEDAAKYKSFDEWFSACDRISEELKEQAARNRDYKNKRTGVSIMTYHSSKGLEFDTCYLPGINDGVVPYKKAGTDAELEEERRMLYVAMTRAKYKLNMSWTKKRFGKEVSPSPFLLRIFGKN